MALLPDVSNGIPVAEGGRLRSSPVQAVFPSHFLGPAAFHHVVNISWKAGLCLEVGDDGSFEERRSIYVCGRCRLDFIVVREQSSQLS